MKTITPVSVWYNGTSVSANKFRLYAIHNDLETKAIFYFELLVNDQPVTNGNLTMTGSDYTSYNSNTYAWNWAAGELGLVII